MTTQEPTDAVKQRIARAVAVMAKGYTLSEAAGRLDMSMAALRQLKIRYPEQWQLPPDPKLSGRIAESPRRREASNQTVTTRFKGAGRETVAKIVSAATLKAQGHTMKEIAKQLGVTVRGVAAWESDNPKIWKDAFEKATEGLSTIVKQVRQEAGTDAVLDDTADYLRRATVADKWCKDRGQSLFDSQGKMTLPRFFEEYYLPARLVDASSRTAELWRGVLKVWRLITGDPDLASITALTLAKFRDAVANSVGMDRVSRKSSVTVRNHLRLVQTLLDKAGPPGPRNRDAAGLLVKVPWIKMPKEVLQPPVVVKADLLSDVYTAAVAMDLPRGLGFKPPAWWRVLLAVTYNTGLRRGTLFKLRMEWIRWEDCILAIPAKAMKSGRVHLIHLNPTVMEHLRSIRTDRELVFPWPHCRRYFDTCFHRLQAAAGILRKDHFGLHNLRKTLATQLWADSPQASQFALGHAGAAVTMRHYVASTGIVAQALDRLQQPTAFTRQE